MILEKEQYELIYRASYFSIFTLLYAFYRRHWVNAALQLCVTTTSINYWRKPDYSWRRYIDMAAVKSALLYQLCYSYNADYARVYYILTGIGVLCYPIGIYYYKRGDHWKSTYAHLVLHAFANICNIVLYSGKI